MRIDCSTCQVRPAACDGCMMQVLFGPVASGDAAVPGELAVVSSRPSPAAELSAAVSVLVSEGLVSPAEGRRARSGIAAAQDSATGCSHDLRSVM